MLKIAALETSAPIGSVALGEDHIVRFERTLGGGMIHGRELVPTLQAGLQQVGWAAKQLELVAVSGGPGSYTGLRVGLTIAKLLAYATGAELVSVSSLDVLAQNYTESDRVYAPVVDARWAQVYSALYRRNGSGPTEKLTEDQALTPEEFLDTLPAEVFLYGDGLRRYGEQFQRKGIEFGAEHLWIPRARHVLRLGWKAYHKKQCCDPATLSPSYLRPTEAEVKRGLKSGR